MAFVTPWGFELRDISAPVLVVHGGRDRMVPPAHADRLVRDIRRAELWYRPDDGHVSILHELPAVMAWLKAQHESEDGSR